MRLPPSSRASRGVSSLFLVGLASLTLIFHFIISRSSHAGYGSQNDRRFGPCPTPDSLMVEGQLLGHLKAIETKLDALLVGGDGVTNTTFTQVLVSLKGEFRTVIDAFNGGSATGSDGNAAEKLSGRITAAIEKAKNVDTVPNYDRPKIRLFVGVFVRMTFHGCIPSLMFVLLPDGN